MARILNDRRYDNKQSEAAKVWIKVAVAVVLFCAAPPVGIIVALVMGKSIFKGLKDQGYIKTDVEGKSSVDWNRARSSGKKAAEDLRSYSRDTAKRYKTHISESDRMDEYLPRKHTHTPVNYSYDKCAQERRLEQIKSLKDAGILDENEYQQRKRNILAGK